MTVSMGSFLGHFDTIDCWIYQEIVAVFEIEPILQLRNGIATDAPAQLTNTSLPARSFLTIGLIVAAALFAVRIATSLRLVPALGVIVGLLLCYEAMAFLASLAAHRILDLSAMPAALILGHAMTVSDHALRARWRRRYIRMRFARHVPSDLAEAIWQRRDQFLRGGRLSSQELPATVLFAEMRGFTLQAETRNAEILMEWVRDYRETMARLIMDHGGVVEGYFGDVLKATFGVPFARERSDEVGQDASNAVACALAMGEALQVLNRRWHDREAPEIVMRVGAATGDVTAVCIRRGRSLTFTTTGDVVRSAAQLVRDLGESDDPTGSPCSCRILIGTATASHLRRRFRLYPIQVGGSESARHSEPVYRVFGKHDRAIFKNQADPRASLRIPVMMPVTVASEPTAAGLTTNISSGGMAICQLARPLSIGATAILQLEVPGHAGPLTTTGTVVWADQDQAGIAFTALPPSDQVMWESFLTSQAVKQTLSAA
ncbi:MAG TPA: adenylate/guanylate cyclase domain-containing protein [Nitrospira sp.]|nr:adenylate/guanylate cyclase domain-containing protein [Nitrospira sp.]